MHVKTCLYMLTVLFLVGCNMQKPCDYDPQTFQHENGLAFTIKICEESRSSRLADGIMVNIGVTDSRSINELTVRLLAEIPNGLDASKSLDGNTYSFSKESTEESSGGKETAIKIWKPLPNGQGIFLDYYVQGPGALDENIIWDCIISAELSP